MSALTASCAGRSVVAGPASSARAEQPCRASSVGSLRVPSRRQQLQLGRPALSKGSRSVVRSALPGSWDQMAREEQQSKNWWQEHKDVMLDIRSPAQWEETLKASKPGELLVVEWVSPTCKHCFAAQGTIILALEHVKDAKLPVKFLRVACDDTETKTLARSMTIRAFPTIAMWRDGKKLIDFNPSQRGDAVGRLTRNIEIVATTNDPKKQFQMLANEVKVVDVDPNETPYVSAAAAVAAAKAAAVAAAAAAAPAKESSGDCEQEEECAPAWETQS